jgi:hypothetical protein
MANMNDETATVTSGGDGLYGHERLRYAVALEEYRGRWTVYDWVPRYANQKWFDTKEEAEAYIFRNTSPEARAALEGK